MNRKPVNQMDATELQKFSQYLKLEMGKQFYNCDKVVDILLAGYRASFKRPRISNVILFGEGGYGKSEMVALFFKLIGETARTFDFSTATSVDEILGGTDLVILREEGVIYKGIQNSFLSHRFVILEEMLSAPAASLSVLRNPLTSGIFSQNQQVEAVKLQFAVICTNTSPEDFIGDKDTEALMQRFQLQWTVNWEKLTPEQKAEGYKFVISKVGSFQNTDVDVIVETAITNSMSPRQVITTCEILEHVQMIDPMSGACEALEMLGIVAANATELKAQRARQMLYSEVNGATTTIMDVTKRMVSLYGEKSEDVTKDVVSAAKMLLSVAKANVTKAAHSAQADVPEAMDIVAGVLIRIGEAENSLVNIAGQVMLRGL